MLQFLVQLVSDLLDAGILLRHTVGFNACFFIFPLIIQVGRQEKIKLV